MRVSRITTNIGLHGCPSCESELMNSNDMMRGLTAPFDPSMNLLNDQTFLKKGTVWREREVKIEKSAQVKDSIIGMGSIIGDKAKVINSVIGRKCVIAPNAVVQNSVLWDNVTLGQGVHLLDSVVEMDNSVPEGSHLSRGVVLLSKTSLPSNTTIQGTGNFTIYGSDGKPVETADASDDEEEPFQIGNSLRQTSLTYRHSQRH